MAFIDFSENGLLDRPLELQPIPQLAALLADHAAQFSALEQRVIALSESDGLDTLRPQRKRSWFAKLLLGPGAPSPVLANERLEALRRLAVETRHHGWRVRTSVIAAAKAAGFTEAQIGRVIDTIGHASAPVRRKFA